MHPAICYRLIDLGTHNEPYQGRDDYGRRLLAGFELPEAHMEDGRPFTVQRYWKYSSNEKARMRKDLEAWRGKTFQDGELPKFDLTKILNTKCMISLKESYADDGSLKIEWSGIGPLPKGTAPMKRTNDLQLLILEKGEFNKAVFESLPDKMREKISRSPEYIDLHTPRNGNYAAIDKARQQMNQDLPDDEIPF